MINLYTSHVLSSFHIAFASVPLNENYKELLSALMGATSTIVAIFFSLLVIPISQIAEKYSSKFLKYFVRDRFFVFTTLFSISSLSYYAIALFLEASQLMAIFALVLFGVWIVLFFLFIVHTIKILAMKLFLSSGDIPAALTEDFLKLVGKKAVDIKFALIENASDPYPENDKEWMYDSRKSFESLGMKVTLVDLRLYKNDSEALYQLLKDFDVVWIGGGNTYYMRWLMKIVGFDAIVKKLLDSGVVYGGGSAGAILPCPILEKFDIVDDQSAAPEVIVQGLELIDFIIVPHWGDPEYQSKLAEIKDYYDRLARYPVVTINDVQAIIIDGNNWSVYPK